VAARIRRELHVAVELVRGRYGEFKVLMGGDVVVDGGSAAFLGVLPSGAKIVEIIKQWLKAG
jgi:hypothetical protein